MSWRERVRDVIRGVIAAHPELRADPRAMLAAIDRAYPFGERRYTPYKLWLEERAKAIDALALAPGHRICGTCGAKPFRPCRDVVTGRALPNLHGSRLGKSGPVGPLFGGADAV